MTKLMEWLCGVSIFVAIWTSLITKQIENDFTHKYMPIITLAPFILVLTFGLYAAAVVLYRVFTFNDCEEASIELHKQILEAKADLTKKGFNFSS